MFQSRLIRFQCSDPEAYWGMFGTNLREAALVSLAVILLFGSLVGGFYLPPPYKVTVLNVWYAATLVVVAFLVIRWFIRRRGH
jgi:hypothetical protein